MKSRDIAHPKLFLKCYLDSDSVRLKYLSNKFNSKGDRLVEELSDSIPDEFSEGLSETFFLTKLNKNELMKLDIFIERQNKLISKTIKKAAHNTKTRFQDDVLTLFSKKICTLIYWF